jgi:hypothetical protein
MINSKHFGSDFVDLALALQPVYLNLTIFFIQLSHCIWIDWLVTLKNMRLRLPAFYFFPKEVEIACVNVGLSKLRFK